MVGKRLVKQFYNQAHSKAYYLGCSQGGRQGINSANKYPDDFDGIVAGAPALDFNNLISWRASFYPITLDLGGKDFITPTIWTGLIHDEVLKQCDELDGVKDGIIEYPDLCHFDPSPLICEDVVDKECLSSNQVEQVRRVFRPLTYSDGNQIYPGMQPGSEARAIDRLYAGKPFSDSQDWFRYVIWSNPDWSPASFTADRDAREAETRNPFDIRTFPSNLNTYKSKGGKVLMYHGMQDQQITGFITSKWYDHLLKTQTINQLDDYIRYFRISGMFHCASGPGAWMIGQGASDLTFERGHNVLAAVVDWVEQGIAPETIEGTKFVQDNSMLGVSFTRKHCRRVIFDIFNGDNINVV
jgi:feruloyl esterase